ncbi:glutathione S-transferase family protein [Labrys wisconsinensis]|uniref:Glutathione S-transferase n=1 Tax=Labrys wisconsinensis TaxID=425677 RepID=A0ABU0IZI7_9HYPH|nr:glutathione S-transferase family protein [Labrys wisconsinensis]MDQ0467426.1 glutathione S-transferase [Labrys wisconsinensis]
MITFYHSPRSRSSSIHWLLEELGAEYKTEIVDIRAPGGAPETYRAIQPSKKVPAIVHDGTVVTERAAICIYLADAFPQAGLAPPVGDAGRAAWLTWLVYSDAVFDPVIAGRMRGLAVATSNDYSFGLYDDMVANLEKTLAARPYIAGEAFTAADTQIGSGIHYAVHILGALADRPVFQAYLGRLQARPAFQRYIRKEMALAAG